jgi:hypothetical protein
VKVPVPNGTIRTYALTVACPLEKTIRNGEQRPSRNCGPKLPPGEATLPQVSPSLSATSLRLG